MSTIRLCFWMPLADTENIHIHARESFQLVYKTLLLSWWPSPIIWKQWELRPQHIYVWSFPDIIGQARRVRLHVLSMGVVTRSAGLVPAGRVGWFSLGFRDWKVPCWTGAYDVSPTTATTCVCMQVVFSAGSTQRHPVIQLFVHKTLKMLFHVVNEVSSLFRHTLYKWHQMALNSCPPHFPPLLHCKRISTSMFQVVTNLMRPRARRRCHVGFLGMLGHTSMVTIHS